MLLVDKSNVLIVEIVFESKNDNIWINNVLKIKRFNYVKKLWCFVIR